MQDKEDQMQCRGKSPRLRKRQNLQHPVILKHHIFPRQYSHTQMACQIHLCKNYGRGRHFHFHHLNNNQIYIRCFWYTSYSQQCITFLHYNLRVFHQVHIDFLHNECTPKLQFLRIQDHCIRNYLDNRWGRPQPICHNTKIKE